MGGTLTQLINLRGVHEPYNHSRMIIGFDTFSGFSTVVDKDGEFSSSGDYSSRENWEIHLEKQLIAMEQLSPLSHIKKFSLIKGDASQTVPRWVNENPHALVAMAMFDMDVYQPTKDALEAILPLMSKGSVLVFDQLNAKHFPGETIALKEVCGLNNIRLRSFPHQPHCAWAIIGD